MIQYIKTQRGSKAVCVQLARQGFDGAEYEFAGSLVEDRNNEERSYVDWLVHVHKYVQLEVFYPAIRIVIPSSNLTALASRFQGKGGRTKVI